MSKARTYDPRKCENDKCLKQYQVRNPKQRFCSTPCRTFVCKPKEPKLCCFCKNLFWPERPLSKYCKTCAPTNSDKNRIVLYGVNFPQWLKMLNEQDGKCYLCMKEKATDMDHSHSTGKVRRPLCGPCNRELGFVEADPEWLERAIDYLRIFGK